MLVKYRIYEHRNNKEISLRELSFLSGVSKSQLNDIENNKRHPSVYTLCLIAKSLEVDPSELFIMSDISDKC